MIENFSFLFFDDDDCFKTPRDYKIGVKETVTSMIRTDQSK